MSVVFRCDASATLGFGHLSRCLALADELRGRGVRSIFVMARGEPDMTSLPSERGHGVRVLGTDATAKDLGREDASEVLTACSEEDASWIVVDHYGATPEYLDHLDAGSHRLCVIDDVGGRDVRGASLVVSPSPGISESEYRTTARCTFLLGPRFAMLAPIFRRQRPDSLERRRGISRPGTVLVSLGGGRVPRLRLSKALSALADALPAAAVHVVVGQAALEAPQVPSEYQVEFHRDLRPDQMAALMMVSDIAIATPSTIAWELSCMGVPAVLVQAAGNQERVRHALARTETAELAGPDDELAPALERLVARMDGSPAQLVNAWARVCDGRGAQRIASALTDEPLVVRDAVPEDMRWVWQVNNDPSVRERSISTAPIPWEGHTQWFQQVLENPNRVLLVAECNGKRVGLVRLDGVGACPEVHISIAVAPGDRGRGHGVRLIEAGVRRAFACSATEAIIARIRPDNIASLRAFGACGFQLETSEVTGGVTLSRHSLPRARWSGVSTRSDT